MPLWCSSEVMVLNAREKRIKKKSAYTRAIFSNVLEKKARARKKLISMYEAVFCFNQSILYPLSINPLFKHVTPRSKEVLVKTCTCMYN